MMHHQRYNFPRALAGVTLGVVALTAAPAEAAGPTLSLRMVHRGVDNNPSNDQLIECSQKSSKGGVTSGTVSISQQDKKPSGVEELYQWRHTRRATAPTETIELWGGDIGPRHLQFDNNPLPEIVPHVPPVAPPGPVWEPLHQVGGQVNYSVETRMVIGQRQYRFTGPAAEGEAPPSVIVNYLGATPVQRVQVDELIELLEHAQAQEARLIAHQHWQSTVTVLNHAYFDADTQTGPNVSYVGSMIGLCLGHTYPDPDPTFPGGAVIMQDLVEVRARAADLFEYLEGEAVNGVVGIDLRR